MTVRVRPRRATSSWLRSLRLRHRQRPFEYALDGLPQAGHAALNNIISNDHLSMPSTGYLKPITPPSIMSSAMIVRTRPQQATSSRTCRLRLCHWQRPFEYALDGLPKVGHVTTDYVVNNSHSITPSMGYLKSVMPPLTTSSTTTVRVRPRWATSSQSHSLRLRHRQRSFEYTLDGLPQLGHATSNYINENDLLSMPLTGYLELTTPSSTSTTSTPSIGYLEPVMLSSTTSTRAHHPQAPSMVTLFLTMSSTMTA